MLASLSSGRADNARPWRLGGALDQTRDLECLTQAVYYEARGETPQGQAAVAQVVMNRLRHRAFPKTICGVVFQGVADSGCQFSFACDGSIHRITDHDAWDRAQKVALRAMDGRVFAAIGNATHFHVAGLETNWGDAMAPVAQIGAHIFYRFNGRPGSGAFHGATIASPAEPSPNPTTPVFASLAPSTAGSSQPASAASLFLATTAAAVEHAASVVESAAKPVVAPKPEPSKLDEHDKGAP